jgi:chaperonin GroES
LLALLALRPFRDLTSAGTRQVTVQINRCLSRYTAIRFPEPSRKRFNPIRAGEQSMNVRPLHDRVIVHRLDEGEQKIGGIIIPDTAKEKPQQGRVIAAGNGKAKDDGKRIPLDVKAGDRILFGKYSGQEITIDGEEYLIMKEDEVLAVMEGQTKKTLAVVKAKTQKKKRK